MSEPTPDPAPEPEPAPEPIPEPPAGPAPIVAGTFAVYADPSGGMVLVTDVAGRGIERRAVPATIVRLVTHGDMPGPVGAILRKALGRAT